MWVSLFSEKFPMTDYWMRWVDFAKLRDLLALITEYPHRFTPMALDRAAIADGTFILPSGEPFGPSSRYHHRRALEKTWVSRPT